MAIKMYVECIDKPSSEEFICTNITVGKIYPVIWIDNDVYLIVDDTNKDRWYSQRFFKDAEWQGELK